MLRLRPSLFNRVLPDPWPARTGLDAHPKPDLETHWWVDPVRVRRDPSRPHRDHVRPEET